MDWSFHESSVQSLGGRRARRSRQRGEAGEERGEPGAHNEMERRVMTGGTHMSVWWGVGGGES